MTVAVWVDDGEDAHAAAGPMQQQRRGGRRARARAQDAAASGAQVVAICLAVRVGFKLAKAAGKLFENRLGCCRPAAESVGEHGEQGIEGADDGDSVTAEDQWVLCSDPVPEPPEGARLMASEHLPISVYHFYEQFLSVQATCLQDHHRSTGQYNFRSTQWRPDGAGRFTRQFDFMQPKKGVCSVNARCLQEQAFSVHAGGVFVLRSDMGMQHIPYADCFRVQAHWQAAPDATGLGCNVSIRVAVPFSRRCLVRGLIMGTTLKDCQAFYTDFLAKVQNSINTELLPAAAAQAAAAEQLLGSSPPAQAGAPPALQLLSPRRPPPNTPFAAVDAEVFVTTPAHQPGGGGAALQHQKRGGSGKHQQQQGAAGHGRHQQQQQQPHGRGVFGWLLHRHGQQQQQQQQGAAAGLQQQPSPQVGSSGGSGGISSRCPTPAPPGAAAAAGAARHPMGRAVSAKPSFGLPIADLRLPNRPQPAVVLGTAQALLLLAMLLVQVITLYELRRLLAAWGGSSGGIVQQQQQQLASGFAAASGGLPFGELP